MVADEYPVGAEKRSRAASLTVHESGTSERLCGSATSRPRVIVGIVLHGSEPAAQSLPLARDAAVQALLVGAVVFGVIAYDAYRTHLG